MAGPSAEAVGEFVDGSPSPVLGEQRGWAFWMVAGDTVFVADLDDGRIASRVLDSRPRPGVMFPTTDGVFVGGVPSWGRSSFVRRDLSVVTSLGDRRVEFPGRSVAWSLAIDGAAIDVAALTGEGSVLRSGRIAFEGVGAWALEDFDPAGMVGDELVLDARGRIVLVDLVSGAARLYAEGEVLAVGGGRVVWTECVAFDSCVAFAGTRDDARAVRLSGRVTRPSCAVIEGVRPPYCAVAIAANGSAMVLGPGLVLDLRTGERQLLDWPSPVLEPGMNTGEEFGVGGVVLSPDGSWLFGVQTNGRVTAVERATGRAVEFDVIVPVDKAEGLVTAFAVG